MRAGPLSVLVIATLLVVTVLGAGVAEAQMDTGESYWGEHMINAIVHLWPAVAIVLFTGLLAAGVFGLFEMDRTTKLFLLAAAAFLAYHFYWQPAHPASGQLRDRPSATASNASGTGPLTAPLDKTQGCSTVHPV